MLSVRRCVGNSKIKKNLTINGWNIIQNINVLKDIKKSSVYTVHCKVQIEDV
jgi:hypothetical protein